MVVGAEAMTWQSSMRIRVQILYLHTSWVVLSWNADAQETKTNDPSIVSAISKFL